MITHGILFSSDNKILGLTAYSDAYYGGDKTTRKSTSGFVIQVINRPVVWGTQKQRTVALSTTKSEYIGASQTVKELIWLSRLMKDLVRFKFDIPVMYVDNQSAIRIRKNPEFHKRTKHIDVRYHFLRQYYEQENFDLQYINTNEQVADIFTKPLSNPRFEYLGKNYILSEAAIINMSTQSGSVEY